MRDVEHLRQAIADAESDANAAVIALRETGDVQQVIEAESRLAALLAASQRCANIALAQYRETGDEGEYVRVTTFGNAGQQQAVVRLRDSKRAEAAKTDFAQMRREEAARQTEAESELRRQDEAIRQREAEERKRNTVQHLPEAPEASRDTAQRSARHVNPVGIQPHP